MKFSDRETAGADFLTSPFISVPYQWLAEFHSLGLSPHEFLLLMQIIAASQVANKDFLSPQELATMCNMAPEEVAELIGGLVQRGFLSIGERLDNFRTQANYFDLRPLWERLRGKKQNDTPLHEWRKDPITLFEEEFGRPLSGLECEQIRQWLDRDGHPEWLVAEALREAVLANKYSFKYIDRILFEWHRHRIRTKQELERYREGYRERTKSKEEVAASTEKPTTPSRRATGKSSPPGQQQDERYAAFYRLFPDS